MPQFPGSRDADPGRHGRFGRRGREEPRRVTKPSGPFSDDFELNHQLKGHIKVWLPLKPLRPQEWQSPRLPDVPGSGRPHLGHAALDVHQLDPGGLPGFGQGDSGFSRCSLGLFMPRQSPAPRARSCVLSLRTSEQLQDYGLDLASVLPNDDGDGVKDVCGWVFFCAPPKP